MCHTKQSEIERLESRAELLERQAGEREDRAAMNYRIGSSSYVDSFDIADGYRAEARELRSEAMKLRISA